MRANLAAEFRKIWINVKDKNYEVGGYLENGKPSVTNTGDEKSVQANCDESNTVSYTPDTSVSIQQYTLLIIANQ